MSAIPAAVTPAVPVMWTQRSSQILGAPAATVTFSGLSDIAYRVTSQYAPTGALETYLRLNNDSVGSYWAAFCDVANGVQLASRSSNTFMGLTSLSAGIYATDYPGHSQIVIQKPSAAQYAEVTGVADIANNTTGTLVGGFMGGHWLNTSDLITRIDLITSANSFKANSTFTVEGIAA